jgi:hypothetical protein
LSEIAKAEKINESYVARVLRLTLLTPDIVEVILGGRHPTQMTLSALMRPLPVAALRVAEHAVLLAGRAPGGDAPAIGQGLAEGSRPA